MRRPGIKICGITREVDAIRAAELGADLLGLNFWPRSPRCIDGTLGRALAVAARRVRPEIQIAGVFVNQSRAFIEGIDRAVGLDLVQLHGDESPEFAASFGKRLLRALRTAGVPAPESFAAYPEAWGFLVDVADSSRYGGTGEGWNYGELAALLEWDGRAEKAAGTLPGTLPSSTLPGTLPGSGQPVWIAGGIGPGNARAALAASGAWGVDVCSGVEVAPGVKNPEWMRELWMEVHHGEGATAP